MGVVGYLCLPRRRRTRVVVSAMPQCEDLDTLSPFPSALPRPRRGKRRRHLESALAHRILRVCVPVRAAFSETFHVLGPNTNVNDYSGSVGVVRCCQVIQPQRLCDGQASRTVSMHEGSRQRTIGPNRGPRPRDTAGESLAPLTKASTDPHRSRAPSRSTCSPAQTSAPAATTH